jgi:2-iminobutanoate/2-iminopropanoate deaminase
MAEHGYIDQEPNLPQRSNPIRHVLVANNMCFVSGQLSVDPAVNYVPAPILQEAKLAFKNFLAPLKSLVLVEMT